MKKIFKLCLMIILLTFISFTYGIKDVDAATGTFTISSSSNVTIGDTFSVVFKATGSKIFYWQFYVSYDASKLKLVSGSTTIQGEADDAIAGQNSVSRTLKFKALKTGSTQISIARGDADMNITSDFGMISYKTVKKTIDIVPVVPKSTNNGLSSLSIDNATLTPEFKTDVLSYTVELEPTTTEININAAVSDSKASIAGAGKVTVTEGINNLNIVVTAENGSAKTYTIAATVKEFAPVEVTVDGKKYNVIRKKGVYESPVNFTETTIKIGKENVLAYNNDKIGTVLGLSNNKGEIGLYLYDAKKDEYTLYKDITIGNINLYLKNLEKNESLPLGYERSSVKINDALITAYNYNGDKNNYLIYGVNTEDGKASFYQYDVGTVTIQKFFDKQVNYLQSTIDKYLLVIIIVSVLGTIFMASTIVLLIMLLKNKKDKPELSQDTLLTKLEKTRKKR